MPSNSDVPTPTELNVRLGMKFKFFPDLEGGEFSGHLQWKDDKTWEIFAAAEDLNLSEILKNALKIPSYPEGLPELKIKRVILKVDSNMNFSMGGRIELSDGLSKKHLTLLGKEIPIGFLEFAFAFSKTDTGIADLWGYIQVKGENLIKTDDIRLETFSFSFEYDSAGAWTLAGSVKGSLFELPTIELSAKYTKEKDKQVLELATNFWHERDAVGDDAFEKIAGITSTDSKKIWRYLRQKEYLDADNRITDELKFDDDGFTLTDLAKDYRPHEKKIIAVLQPSKPLIKIPGIASMDVRTLKLTLKKNGSKKIEWEFLAASDFKIGDLSIENGELSFSGDTNEKSLKLTFTAEEARIKSPRIHYTQVIDHKEVPKKLGFDIKFGEIILEKKDGWSFKSSVDFYFQDIPTPLDKLFLKAGMTSADFSIEKIAGKWEMSAGLTGTLAEIPLPDPIALIKALMPPEVDLGLHELGEGAIGLYGVRIRLDDGLKLETDIGIGLASNLNEFFGLKDFPIFKTYKKGDEESIIKAKLSVGTKGLSGVIKDSPFRKIEGIEDTTLRGKEWVELDFDKIFDEKDLGLIRIQKPELALNIDQGSFRASGGYEIDHDRKVKIPLFPIKKVLELLKLKELAQAIPDGIPIQTIKFFEGGELNVQELERALNWMGIRLPQEIRDVIHEIGKEANNLPDRFKEYLNINIPEGLDFAIDITGDGSVSFDLKVTGDPFQLLMPMIPSPMLLGIRLHRLSFGTAFGNSLLKLEVDGEIDTFHLLTLAGAVLFPHIEDKNIKEILPETSKLQQTFIAQDLVVLIVYETGIPIPIPLFYKKLEFSYFGIDGFESRELISFPKPSFSAKEFLDRITALVNFFTTRYQKGVFDEKGTEKGLLPIIHYGGRFKGDGFKSETLPEPESQMDISFYAGPLYVRLPKYLGFEDTDYFEITNKKYESWGDETAKGKISKENHEKIKDLRGKRFLTEGGFKWEISKRIGENETAQRDIIVDECRLSKPMGQFIGTPLCHKLFSAWDLIYLVLNSVKKASINYPIQYFNIEDRVGDVQLHLFKIFDVDVGWALTTPYEFVKKRIVAGDKFAGLVKDPSVVWKDLSDKGYIDKGGGVEPAFYDLGDVSEMILDEKIASKRSEIFKILQNAETVYDIFLKKYKGSKIPESPANELLLLLADNDTGQEISEEDEGLAIFLRGGLDIGKGAVLLESALGLVANGVSGFKTGLSFRGFVMNVVDVKLLGFIKISPKSKTEPFKLLGKSSLKVFNREIMMGLFELTTGKDAHLHVAGKLDLFPEGWPIKLKGHVLGVIDKERFLFDSEACFELGGLKALASLHIKAEKSKSELTAQIEFLNSSLYVQFLGEVKAAKATMLLGINLNALNIIKFRSNVNAAIDMTTGAALTAQSTLDIGIPLPNKSKMQVVHIDTVLKGAIDLKRGYLNVEAIVKEKSFVLSPHCSISGGFAFYVWFSGDSQKKIPAGDFVLSVGGYHPKFIRPAHYPKVTKTRIQWKISNKLLIKGSAYFALTPSCIMAGGGLEMVWQSGGLKAWFTAQAHFVLAWQPFFYDARIRVSVGVSYTFKIKVLKIKKTFSYQLGADLHVWGPDLSGRAHINLGIISFTIQFINSTASRPAAMKQWSTFRAAFLPPSKEADKDDLLKIRVSDGLVKDFSDDRDEKIDWVINPQQFSLRTSSVIPVKELYSGKEKTPYASKFGVAPMNVKSNQFNTTHKIRLFKGKSESPVDDEFGIEPIVGNSPKAIWGESMTPDLNGKQPLILDTVTGFDIKPKNPQKNRGQTSKLSALALKEEGVTIEDAFAWEAVTEPAYEKTGDATNEIRSTLRSSTQIRSDIIKDFFNEVDADEVDLSHLENATELSFLVKPQVLKGG